MIGNQWRGSMEQALTARFMSELKKITVNGREYDRIEQMPPEVREEYLQAVAALREAGANATPGPGNQNVLSSSVVTETFTYNGREYNSRDELPPEAQALLAQIGEPSAADKTTNVEIKTVKTFPPEVRIIETTGDARGPAPEGSSKLAWLLVKILVVVVLVLFGVLFWRLK